MIVSNLTLWMDFFSFCLVATKRSVHLDARKKDRRKVRASSLESSAESESSAMETGDGNSGQVAAVSSTASFKSPAVGMGEEETNGEKQVDSLSFFFFQSMFSAYFLAYFFLCTFFAPQ